jgi:hypothetical protein
MPSSDFGGLKFDILIVVPCCIFEDLFIIMLARNDYNMTNRLRHGLAKVW